MAGYHVRKKADSKEGEVHYEDQSKSLESAKKVLVRWKDGTKTAISIQNIVHFGFFD